MLKIDNETIKDLVFKIVPQFICFWYYSAEARV